MVKFSDAVLLPANASSALQATTKQQLDAAVAAITRSSLGVDPDLANALTIMAVQQAQIDAMRVAGLGYSIRTGLKLSASATAGKLQYSAGTAIQDALDVVFAANTAITGSDAAHDDITEMADATNPKWVRVELNGTAIDYTLGTAAAVPVFPLPWSSTKVPLGALYIPAGATNASPGIDELIDTPNDKVKLYDMRQLFRLPPAGWEVTKKLASNFTTTSTTAVDVTGLSGVTLAASKRYEFELVLYCGSSSTAGIKISINTDATSSPDASCIVIGTTTDVAAGVQTLNGFDVLSSALITGAGGAGTIVVKGHVTWSGSGGNFNVRTAKVTSGTSFINAGSTLKIRSL